MRIRLVFGIDLTATPSHPSACLGLNENLEAVYFGFLAEDSEIIALANLYSPEVIAIDAPLSVTKSGIGIRLCERKLARRGIPCFFTTEKSIVKKMVYRGIRLKAELEGYGFQVIEVYPYASKVRLFGKAIPRKTTVQGITFLKENLGRVLPSLKPWLDIFDHNLSDAAVAAYTAFLYCQGRAEALGDIEEGLIFIPSPLKGEG